MVASPGVQPIGETSMATATRAKAKESPARIRFGSTSKSIESCTIEVTGIGGVAEKVMLVIRPYFRDKNRKVEVWLTPETALSLIEGTAAALKSGIRPPSTEPT
jgi:hypothetical protein